jgi:D-lactate dehydrogenase
VPEGSVRVAVFSTKTYDRLFLEAANERYRHELAFFEAPLLPSTAALASDFPAVCVFVNDRLDAAVLRTIHRLGTRLVALRCAGFNNVDLLAARDAGITVVRVPAYSPHAVAEHTIGLILALDRKIHRAHARVREGNFSLEGLLGFELHGRTVGVVGTGKIGTIVARILRGFGCRVLAHDPYPNRDCVEAGCEYVSLDEMLPAADVLTLHCPLTPETYHLVDAGTLARMKDGVMLVNTSRGALVNTPVVIEAVKDGKIGYLGLDVYEEEQHLFFRDLSDRVIKDDVFARLLTFPNVIITAHQAFFTRTALENIADTTLANIRAFELREPTPNEVHADAVVA